jgi:hypothetical protein
MEALWRNYGGTTVHVARVKWRQIRRKYGSTEDFRVGKRPFPTHCPQMDTAHVREAGRHPRRSGVLERFYPSTLQRFNASCFTHPTLPAPGKHKRFLIFVLCFTGLRSDILCLNSQCDMGQTAMFRPGVLWPSVPASPGRQPRKGSRWPGLCAAEFSSPLPPETACRLAHWIQTNLSRAGLA